MGGFPSGFVWRLVLPACIALFMFMIGLFVMSWLLWVLCLSGADNVGLSEFKILLCYVSPKMDNTEHNTRVHSAHNM